MGRKPNYEDNLDLLFGTTEVEEIKVTRGGGRIKPKKKNTVSTGQATKNNHARFSEKLERGAFDEFDHKDWFQYFVHKAKEQGVKYLTRNYARDYAIIKSLQKELTWLDIKNMMDFVFDSNQDIFDKRTVGMWILSKGWINSIYQNTQLWIQGNYKPAKAPSRNREWIPAEASKKDSGTGIRYGSPVKEEESEPSEQPKRKKRSLRIN